MTRRPASELVCRRAGCGRVRRCELTSDDSKSGKYYRNARHIAITMITFRFLRKTIVCIGNVCTGDVSLSFAKNTERSALSRYITCCPFLRLHRGIDRNVWRCKILGDISIKVLNIPIVFQVCNGLLVWAGRFINSSGTKELQESTYFWVIIFFFSICLV